MFIKPETQALISSILNNEGWTQGQYCLVNTETKQQIWIANGAYGIDFYPSINAFNFFERRAIHRAAKQRIIINGLPKNIESSPLKRLPSE